MNEHKRGPRGPWDDLQAESGRAHTHGKAHGKAHSKARGKPGSLSLFHMITVGIGAGAVFLAGEIHEEKTFSNNREAARQREMALYQAIGKKELEDQRYADRTGECVQSLMGLDAFAVERVEYDPSKRRLTFGLQAPDAKSTLTVDSALPPAPGSRNMAAFYDSITICADFVQFGDRAAARRDLRATGFKPEAFTFR